MGDGKKTKIATLSYLHAAVPMLTKDKKEKMPHCPVFIKMSPRSHGKKTKIATLSYLQAAIPMLTKDKKKKMRHCPIFIKTSPCSRRYHWQVKKLALTATSNSDW